MTIYYAVVEPATGEVKGVAWTSTDNLDTLPETTVRFPEGVIPFGIDYWFNGTDIVDKQDYTLEALPIPCTLTIEGVEYLVTEQPTFTFNYPGTYTIKVDAGPRFLLKEFEYDYQP